MPQGANQAAAAAKLGYQTYFVGQVSQTSLQLHIKFMHHISPGLNVVAAKSYSSWLDTKTT